MADADIITLDSDDEQDTAQSVQSYNCQIACPVLHIVKKKVFKKCDLPYQIENFRSVFFTFFHSFFHRNYNGIGFIISTVLGTFFSRT